MSHLDRAFVIPKTDQREAAKARVCDYIDRLPATSLWKVQVSATKPKRSEQQNRFLFGVVYREILKHLPGWDVEDVHEYCLGEFGGWETIEGFGRKRLRAIERSSAMNKQRFTDFVDFIQRTMAARGIVIPDPDSSIVDHAEEQAA